MNPKIVVIFINTNYFSIFLIIFLVGWFPQISLNSQRLKFASSAKSAGNPYPKKSRPEESGRDVFKHEKNLQSLFFPVFRRKTDA